MSSIPPTANDAQRALFLLQQGDTQRAEAICRELLASEPQDLDARYVLGIACLQSRRFALAEDSFRWVLSRNPKLAPVHVNLAFALLAQQRSAEALEHADAALSIDDTFADAWINRAEALALLGKPQESLASFERAARLAPRSAPAHLGRGQVLLGRGQLDAALAAFELALEIDAGRVAAWSHRGSTLRRLRRPAEAIASYEAGLRLDPTDAALWSNLGNVHLETGDLEQAIACCDRALRIRPQFPEALNIRAVALRDCGRHREAARDFAALLRSAPDFDYALGNYLFACANQCDWTERESRLPALLTSVAGDRRAALPFSFLSLSDSAAAQRRCAATFVADRTVQRAFVPRPAARRPGRIRLAYVSGDFRDHAVSFLLVGVLERHDPSRFETYGVSLRPPDARGIGPRVQRAFTDFIDVSAHTAGEVAALMIRLDIDVAIDLTGFTAGARPEIFAQRAAPVQVGYLGYPGTSGAGYMDYLIADDYVVPPAARDAYAERIVYLPDCFQCFDDRRAVGVVAPDRAAVGLPERGFVFCCFNNHYKLNPAMFAIWMRLLARTPGSVLWLLGGDAALCDALRHEARARGVDPGRLVFAERCGYDAHLARLPLADLFLDCLPFNAGATASDALSMGLPLLTVSGEAYAARMAGSLLRALAMPELIAADLADYEARALQLAVPGGPLRALRDRLAAARPQAALFATDRFRRHLESAYETMWERLRRGEQPASFAVPSCTG